MRKFQEEFRAFVANLNFTNVTFIPVSALKGDNVVHMSATAPRGIQGKTILQHLETVPIEENLKSEEFYFPVQYVIRPNLDFRGFSGTIASGEIGVGEEIIVLPSGKSSRVKSIVTYDGELRSAFQDQAVTITLEDEIDISRGDVLVKPENPFHLTHRFTSHLVWMNEEGLKPGKAYWVKQASSLYQGSVSQIAYRVNMDDLSQEKTETLELNDIGGGDHHGKPPLGYGPLPKQPPGWGLYPHRPDDQPHGGSGDDLWLRLRRAAGHPDPESEAHPGGAGGAFQPETRCPLVHRPARIRQDHFGQGPGKAAL
jgi:sulfate adenylyltransferase subunit 1 (EFTu-like GTPase family)